MAIVYSHQLNARSPLFIGQWASARNRVIVRKESVAHAAHRFKNGVEAKQAARDDLDKAEAQLMSEPPAGHRVDTHHAGLSNGLYIVLVLVLGAIAFAIDIGSLLILELDRQTTNLFAAGLVVATIGSAHVIGSTSRRVRQVGEESILGDEPRWRRLALVVGHGLVILVGWVRALEGEGVTRWAIGALFIAIGVLDLNLASWAAFHHSHPAAKQTKDARRALRRGAKGEEVDFALLLRMVADWDRAWRRAMAEALRIVARADELIALDAGGSESAQPRPARAIRSPDPDWLNEIRTVSRGEIPQDCDVRPVLLAVGIDSKTAALNM